MRRQALGVLTATLFGIGTVATLTEPAQADGTVQYRVIVCDSFQPLPPFPPPPDYVEPDPEFLVTTSTLPGDINQLCEVVIESLVNKGFEIIKILPGPATSSFTGVSGIVHYFERRSDDD